MTIVIFISFIDQRRAREWKQGVNSQLNRLQIGSIFSVHSSSVRMHAAVNLAAYGVGGVYSGLDDAQCCVFVFSRF